MVKDIEKATEGYSTVLGLKPWKRGVTDVPETGCRSNFIPLGEQSILLIQPVVPATPIARFLEEHGEGLFNVCLLVDDLAEEIKSLRASGALVTNPVDLTSFPWPMREAWIERESTMGVNINLIESVKKKQ